MRCSKIGKWSKFVVIVGEEEFKKGKVMLRDMKNSNQEEVSLSEIITKLKGR